MVLKQIQNEALTYSERWRGLQESPGGPRLHRLKQQGQKLIVQAFEKGASQTTVEKRVTHCPPLARKIKKIVDPKTIGSSPVNFARASQLHSHEILQKLDNKAKALQALYKAHHKPGKESFRTPSGDYFTYKQLRLSEKRLMLHYHKLAEQLFREISSGHACGTFYAKACELEKELKKVKGIESIVIERLHTAFGKVAKRHQLPYPNFS